MTALSTSALAALRRLEKIPHHARMVFEGYASEPRINREEAVELAQAGYATLDNGTLYIRDAGRERLAREDKQTMEDRP